MRELSENFWQADVNRNKASNTQYQKLHLNTIVIIGYSNRNKQRLEAAQMKFLRSFPGLTGLNKKRIGGIRKTMKVANFNEDMENTK